MDGRRLPALISAMWNPDFREEVIILQHDHPLQGGRASRKSAYFTGHQVDQFPHS